MKNMLIILFLLLLTSPAYGQELESFPAPRPVPEYEPYDLTPLGEESPYSYNQRNKGTQTVLQHLRVNENVYMRYCMNENAPMGCEERVRRLVNMMFTAARQHELDPWILLGLAIETSNFNPFNVDDHVATGIFGISHDRHWRRNERFFREPEYREQCRNEPDACQENIIIHTAEMLARYQRRCNTEHRSLQAYYSGRCTGDSRFARHVLRWSRNLQERAESVPYVNVCEEHPMLCSDPIGGIDLD